jgi:hypothetical protein
MSEQEKNSESSTKTSGEKEPTAGNDGASMQPFQDGLEQEGLLPQMKRSGVSRESLLGLHRAPGDDGL